MPSDNRRPAPLDRVLRTVLYAKVSETATDHSRNNTVRNMLCLPLTSEEKHSAKQATDTFFVRLGDVMSAALVFAGANWMGLSAREFAMVNAALVVVWVLIVVQIGCRYNQLTGPGESRKAA